MTTRSNYRPWNPSYATATLPPSCTTAAALSRGYTCASSSPGIPALPLSSCFPWGTPTSLSSDYTFYSPATACPSGYNYERSRTRTTSLISPRSAAAQDQWINGETAVYCCPDRYAWSDVAGHCRLQYGGVWPNVNCTDGGDVGTMTLSEVGDPVRAVAPAVQVRFRESDGTFLPPKSTEAVTTPVGGGRPAQTEGPETGGVLEGGDGEGSGEVTQSVAKPGSADGGRARVKRAVGVGLVVVLGVLLAQ